jgi:hypothetical protein
MYRKLVAMTICASVCALAIGCGGSGSVEGGGNDEVGKKAIEDATAAMAKKKADEEKSK